MNTSSYLFMSKKYNNFKQQEMEKQSIADSNMSVDSLERDFNAKTSVKDTASDDNVQTILVPFYEKDVLIKVPKNQTRRFKPEKTKFIDRFRKDNQHSNYLVNKDERKMKRTTYLEIFRKQITKSPEKVKNNTEIRSISPEVGDTERESFEEDQNDAVNEFYNTESYNEIYYEKLLNNQMLDNDFDHSSDEGTLFNEDLGSRSPNDNLRSVSEVSQRRHRHRRATVVPVENIKLGGLGPDVEKIKPRLERARSLQRYSEQVRMANRLRIYKKSVLEDNHKREEREITAKQDSPLKLPVQKQVEENASYLVNKSAEDKSSQLVRKIYDSKAKSATVQKRDKVVRKEEQSAPKSAVEKRNKVAEKQKCFSRDLRGRMSIRKEDKGSTDETFNVRVKSSSRSRAIRTEIHPVGSETPPVHISFLVNLGGLRPSSALRSLEEKHQHYQEQVKAYIDYKD